jgi:hypothetical protein
MPKEDGGSVLMLKESVYELEAQFGSRCHLLSIVSKEV